MMIYLAGGLAAALIGFAAYVRLAPSDPTRWHVPVAVEGQEGTVVSLTGGASMRVAGDGAALLARLDAVALATPRTIRLAGSVAEGRITWITRSALWGFPDYITAEAGEDALSVLARLRFGSSDMGVNAARLSDWLARL
jgi:uncharacterized protein (DUF1499 family)